MRTEMRVLCTCLYIYSRAPSFTVTTDVHAPWTWCQTMSAVVAGGKSPPVMKKIEESHPLSTI